MTTQLNEQAGVRQKLFNTMTSIPHGDYGVLVSAFDEALREDPDFAAHVLTYLALGNTRIRDQQDAAVIALLRSDPSFPEYREAGRVCLLGKDFYDIRPEELDVPGIPPFRIFRIMDWMSSQSVGQSPRLMKSVARDFLGELESNPLRFEGIAMRKRKALKQLYVHYHVPMGDQAKAILIDKQYAADSKLDILRRISESKDPYEQARLVMENRIPYTVAATLMEKVHPAVMIALIDVMTPQEALNSRAWVERSGLMETEEVRKVYLEKVSKATASAATTEFRKSAQGTDQRIEEAVAQAREQAVKEQQRIQKNTVLLGDMSGSMSSYFGVMQEIGSRIAPLCNGEFACILFNDYAKELKVTDNTLAGWKQAFRSVRSGGYTSMQAGFDLALKNGYSPEQVIIVTDGNENQGSYAASASKYALATGNILHTIIVYVTPTHDGGEARRFIQGIRNAGLRFDEFTISGEDWYVYDQIAAVLGGPPAMTIVERILDTPFPHRESWIAH